MIYTVEKDNGYYQFANDSKHDDGIERYYVFSPMNIKTLTVYSLRSKRSTL